jgi:hypothetical protein
LTIGRDSFDEASETTRRSLYKVKVKVEEGVDVHVAVQVDVLRQRQGQPRRLRKDVPGVSSTPLQLDWLSAAPLRYLCMSTTQTPEVAVYPDSHKVAFSTALGGPAGGPFEVQRLGTSLTYYDGEDG